MQLIPVPQTHIDIATKFCNGCSLTKSFSDFYKSKSKRDGYESRCKQCSQAAGKLKYAANKDKINQRSRARQKANPEKHREIVSAWRKRNPELVKERDKIWRGMNPEKVRLKGHSRRARRKNADGKISSSRRKSLFVLQRGKCACCGLPLGDNYHLDHIMPIALGGSNSDENTQLLRAGCNLQKSAKHPVDFMQQRGFLL